MVGLPGTGLGGIFYILLVVWIGAREAWRAARGCSCETRSIRVAKLALFGGAIVAALWLEGWLLFQIFGPLPNLGLGPDGRILNTADFAVGALAPALALAPFLLLALLMLAMHLCRFLLRIGGSSPVLLRIHLPENADLQEIKVRARELQERTSV